MNVLRILVMGALLSTLGVGSGAAMAAAASNSKALVIDATGAGVSGGMGMRSSGFAKGTITVNKSTNEVCYRIKDRRLGVVEAADIHAGKKGVNGGVVAQLNIAAFNMMSMAPACVKVTPPVARSLFAKPALYYFDVQTKAFPNGAVRSQL